MCRDHRKRNWKEDRSRIAATAGKRTERKTGAAFGSDVQGPQENELEGRLEGAFPRLSVRADQHAGAGPGVGIRAVPGVRRGSGSGQGLGRGLVQGLGGAARLGAGPGAIRGAVLGQWLRAGPAVVQGRQENELNGGQEPHSVMLCSDHRKTN
jgi:hypothetical protein